MNTIPQPRNGFTDATLKADRLDTDAVKRIVAAEFENSRTDGIPSHLEEAQRIGDTRNLAFYKEALEVLPEMQQLCQQALERVFYGKEFHAQPPVIDVPKTADLAWVRWHGVEVPAMWEKLEQWAEKRIADRGLTDEAATEARALARTFCRDFEYFSGNKAFYKLAETLIPARGAAVAAG